LSKREFPLLGIIEAYSAQTAKSILRAADLAQLRLMLFGEYHAAQLLFEKKTWRQLSGIDIDLFNPQCSHSHGLCQRSLSSVRMIAGAIVPRLLPS
jgi:hypothetical protein